MSSVRARVRRRSLLILGPVVALSAAAVVAVNIADGARATSGASPYEVPAVVDTHPAANVVETTIVADETMVDIGNGVQAKAFTYNGTIPGPDFRLKVGDTVIATLENRLDVAETSIHWHGIELNNASDGTAVTQDSVPPGASYRYEFQVRRPGVYWYHPHFEGSTVQVSRGLVGTIYVVDAQGDESRLVADGVLPPPARTKTLMLGDTTVCKAPGTNDATTYPDDPNLPWAGGPPGSYVTQAGAGPEELCETSPLDEMGDPRAEPFGEGEIPNPWTRGRADAPEGQTVLTNGTNVGARAGSPEQPGALAANASTLAVAPGSGVRLQLVNGAHSRYFRLRLTDSAGAQIPLARIGGEGGLLDRAVLEGGDPGGFDTKYELGEIVLGPSERADVVAAIPAMASGVATLWTLDYSRLSTGFSNIPTVPVMHLDVTGAPVAPPYTIQGAHPSLPTVTGTPLLAAPTVNHPVQPVGPATGTLLDPAQFSTTKPGSADPRIRMTLGIDTPGFAWGIDGVPGPHDAQGGYAETPRITTTRYGRLGDVIDLSVENRTFSHHPFHFHGFSFQPLRFVPIGGGTPYEIPYTELVDVVDIPPGFILEFRLLVEDRTLQDGATAGGGLGRWMFHCHIFPHQTGGLMSEFIVVDPDGNERPNVDTPTTSVTGGVGRSVSVTGRISDPDGDAVALRSSIGIVTDNGDGTWTWTYTAQARPDENQVVYVTARDAEGNESQTSFSLALDELLGYRLVAGDGGIFTYGARAFHGSTGSFELNAPVVGGATNPVGFDGYWVVAADGGVFAFNSPFFGSLGNRALSSPAVAMEASPSGRGYWIVLADGTVHAFGDARLAGNMAGLELNEPVISMAATRSGLGYWLLGSDGGVFAFGDAGFHGSTGGLVLNAPVVDLAPAADDRGYHLVAGDGGVFSYGSATFQGSMGGRRLNAPAVAMLAAPGGLGYWLASADGGVFSFGAIPFLGSLGGRPLNAPVLDIIR